MNVADLVAKIQIEVDKKELSKLPETLDKVKGKVEELGEKFEESAEIQKETGEQTNKLASLTEKASKAAKGFATVIKGLVGFLKSALSLFFSLIGAVLKFTKSITSLGANWLSRGASSLEQMYEKAGKLGASLRLLSTEFGLTPEALQKWQVLAESAGTSQDAMNGILSSVTQLRREAIKNPFAAPDALLYAGIRPGAYSSDEGLLNAILRAASRFKNERARMAWLEDVGIGDAASFNLLLKQWQKGQKVDSQYLVSNENVEKLSKLNIEITKFERLSESIKNNFLAAISDSFIKQLQRFSDIIINSVKTVEGFIAKHGGFEKVFGDISGVFNKIIPLGNSLAGIAKVISQFGAFTTTIVTFGVALGAVVKVADMLVESFTKAVGLVGSLKELFYGFAAMKIQELIDSGAIPEEYLPDAQKAQKFFKAGAGVYQDPKQVTKSIDDIKNWLFDLPGKLISKLASVLGNVLMRAFDYLLNQILMLWAKSGLPGSESAMAMLYDRYSASGVGDEKLKDFLETVQDQIDQTVRKDKESDYSFTRLLPGGKKTDWTARGAFYDLADLFDKTGALKEGISRESILRVPELLRLATKGKDTLAPAQKTYINNITQTNNLNPQEGSLSMIEKITKATQEGVGKGMNLEDTAGAF